MPEPRAREVVVRAPAKINLHLGVGGVREDGFHPLATVYQAIALFSTVTVVPADQWAVTCRAEPGIAVDQVPLGPTNLALRAARLLAERHGIEKPVAIHLDKGIPVAGGLAGGSADAAATLLACAHLWGLPTDDLAGLAAELGSDVPFGLVGGTASGLGRGEVIAPLVDNGEHHWVLLTFEDGLSTPAVYAEFDALHDGLEVPEPVIPDALVSALASGSSTALGGVLGNDLQEAALSLRPALDDVLRAGREAGALAGLVSGSGPTCLFLARDMAHRVELADRLAGGVAGAKVLTAHGPVPGATVVGLTLLDGTTTDGRVE
ncbi:4-(cytidine 5'-diphospho)-2-C-methyl-D-erythritol kinase [Nocardioides sp. AE5]|uniref:4-(cytidine 5'-diphospho)-2-C-methyl-D-erythritol kinase n=1 Tax=Nocardioides sp. AE5 TaxID=2962573 RepID=UPI0028813000|nr:4-(cytidine 5'-diphospho)-2-C-methyl-D-erythritol kinase [Nocardioides sp. AE5]MDT0203754.1 4-(cytidine 5'-diphospho)-2-C-methyl-D-erythritol kinase [Nocardioides sp. AE5]